MQSCKTEQKVPTSSCTEHNKHNIRNEGFYARSRKKAAEDAKKACEIGVEEYIWRTAKDARVCGRCAANEGRRFRYASSPVDGLPGYADGCRCWAEPIIDVNKLKDSKQGKNKKTRKAKKQSGSCLLCLVVFFVVPLFLWVFVF